MSNVLRLCHLCARPACRRAQACRGEPRECLARYAPLVPEEARDGAQAMMESKDIGLSFDELRDEAPEVDDLIEWQELVQTSAARGKEMRVAAGKAHYAYLIKVRRRRNRFAIAPHNAAHRFALQREQATLALAPPRVARPPHPF